MNPFPGYVSQTHACMEWLVNKKNRKNPYQESELEEKERRKRRRKKKESLKAIERGRKDESRDLSYPANKSADTRPGGSREAYKKAVRVGVKVDDEKKECKRKRTEFEQRRRGYKSTPLHSSLFLSHLFLSTQREC